MFSELGRMLSSMFDHVTKGGKATKIETRTDEVKVDFPGADPVDLTLEIGFGDLNLAPGATRLVEGTATYNIQEWTPEIVTTEGRVSIKQNNAWSIWPEDFRNRWDFKLGAERPYKLTVRKGFSKGAIGLGGIPLTGLTIEVGAGETQLAFGSPNPGTAGEVILNTGAGTFLTDGLLNANAKSYSIQCGTGETVLNFTGKMPTQDTHATVRMGVGEVKLNVLNGVPTQVTVSRGLGSIQANGAFQTKQVGSKTVCETAGFADGDGPKLVIEVSAGVGAVKLNTVG